MSLINVAVDLEKIVRLLERIAEALERAYPPTIIPRRDKPHTEEDLIVLDNEKLWNLEQEELSQKAKAQNLPVDSLR